jgi:muramoyltetrapeptide carboxypeptidase
MSSPRVAIAPLRPGDTVAIFAGSSPFDRTLALRGMGFLRERYRVIFQPDMFTRAGYLAGDDDRRTRELSRYLLDEHVRALVAVRGGYGLSRIVDRLPLDAFAAAPKWIVGFSDVTALHVELTARGLPSVHGGNAASLGLGDAVARAQWLETLEGPYETRRWDDLEVVQPGVAEGVLVGGNLTLLHACAAAGKLRLPPDSVLFFEDVTERPYRIDRMLATLASGGHFDRVRAVLLGTFTGCGPGPDRVRVEQVVGEFVRDRRLPTLSSGRFGHGRHNDALVLGSHARIDAQGSTGRLLVG